MTTERKKITWRELIAEISKFQNLNDTAEVAVRTYTQKYPVAYLEPSTYAQRLYVDFPEGYSVSKRKGAKET